MPRLPQLPARPLFVALLSLVLAAPALAGPVSAQQAKNLRLVTPRGERPDAVFPAFTRSVEARFDYVEASQTSMALIVYGPGGLRLFRKDGTYDGTGTASVTVTGKDLMRGLAAGLANNAQELQRAAAQAANAQRGVREYLNGVVAAMMLIKNAQRFVAWSNLPKDAEAADLRLTEAIAALDVLVARARLFDDNDDAGLRGVAALMASPAADALAAARAFDTAVKDVDAAIMPTGGGSHEAEAYVLSVMVDGVPAASTLMWVKLPIYLPYAHQRR